MNIRDRYQEIIKGMESEDRLIQWDTMVTWCKIWIDVEKKELKPLLDLIIDIKEIGFWDSFYPSQSHRALGICLGKNYTERYELPMVYISYNPTEKNFAIQYQKGQGGETIRTECGTKVSKNEFKEIHEWLNNKTCTRVNYNKKEESKIYIDFNAMIERDLILLSKTDFKKDANGNTIQLKEGMKIKVYMDDRDEFDKRDDLIAYGTVEQNNSGVFTTCKWNFRVDTNGIRHESELSQD
ncbi:hypothetical protein [uncultured Aquimarina sp.]|uniref:hypothetical protein n=1 Tax=uncultured Aquimarina sp. TaxID=575652 RepID=UPI0026039AD5|nr:hypothetical protein [uncultured Aquimarina sp.]